MAIHIGFVVLLSTYFGQSTVATLPEALNLMALSVAITYLYVERIDQHRSTGTFIFGRDGSIGGILSLAQFEPRGGAAGHLFESSLFGLHAIAAILGYTAFLVGAVYGLMYLLALPFVETEEFGLIFERLPSLDVMSKMVFGATFLGWIFLTITILFGVGMSMGQLLNSTSTRKFLSTLAVWAVYGTAVFTWFALNWRGLALFIFFGRFVFAMVAMMGSVFIWSSFHAFLT